MLSIPVAIVTSRVEERESMLCCKSLYCIIYIYRYIQRNLREDSMKGVMAGQVYKVTHLLGFNCIGFPVLVVCMKLQTSLCILDKKLTFLNVGNLEDKAKLLT